MNKIYQSISCVQKCLYDTREYRPMYEKMKKEKADQKEEEEDEQLVKLNRDIGEAGSGTSSYRIVVVETL